MDRIAVFVDAGYVFAAGAVALTGKTLLRGELQLDAKAVSDELATMATKLSGLSLLRIYWYDGTSSGPTKQHEEMAYQPNVKVRLGIVNRLGEQKGVDSLVVTDMIKLARHQAVADILLLSGDEDLRVGVQQAQEFGIRVHLLGIVPHRKNQSNLLLQEADTVNEWTRPEIEKFLSIQRRLTLVELTPGEVDPLEKIAKRIMEQLEASEIETSASAGTVSREIDSVLLVSAGKFFDRDLTYDEKLKLRAAFVQVCRERPA